MQQSSDDRRYDVVVYGATGFTGRLVAEHLVRRYGAAGDIAWAIAGRSRDKLEKIRKDLDAPDLPVLVADASDAASLKAMAAAAKVIITTVGPYQLYGEGLVAACADAGTDYVDLCGEPAWMADMIARYHDRAVASGARIVFSCGFDSIPFDLGVVFAQQRAMARFGAPLSRIRGRVRSMKGGFSGGTAASLMATLEAAGRDPQIRRTLANPFALTPGFAGPPQPSGDRAQFDEAADAWAGPFIMAAINTRNVHRTNFLLGRPFGDDFAYDEMMLTGSGSRGRRRARMLVRATQLQAIILAIAPLRALVRRFALPQPGQGPSLEQRESGSFDVLFIGETGDGRIIRASVSGDRDPGYGSTSRMIAETALCLVDDRGPDRTAGGIWTPGAALGARLIERLEAKAGLAFREES